MTIINKYSKKKKEVKYKYNQYIHKKKNLRYAFQSTVNELSKLISVNSEHNYYPLSGINRNTVHSTIKFVHVKYRNTFQGVGCLQRLLRAQGCQGNCNNMYRILRSKCSIVGSSKYIRFGGNFATLFQYLGSKQRLVIAKVDLPHRTHSINQPNLANEGHTLILLHRQQRSDCILGILHTYIH